MSVKKFEISLTSKIPLDNAFWMFGEFFAASLMISCVVSEFMVRLNTLIESTFVDPSDIGLMMTLVVLYLSCWSLVGWLSYFGCYCSPKAVFSMIAMKVKNSCLEKRCTFLEDFGILLWNLSCSNSLSSSRRRSMFPGKSLSKSFWKLIP